jgi:signal transduction protein with GAF and PtsI domain
MTPLRWLGIRSRGTGAGVVVTPVGASLGIGYAIGRVSISHGTTLEGRIATIEARLDDVDQDLKQLRTRLSDQQAQLARRISEAEESLRGETAAIQQLVKALSADSIRRRLIGGTLIVAGTFLTILALWLP